MIFKKIQSDLNRIEQTYSRSSLFLGIVFLTIFLFLFLIRIGVINISQEEMSTINTSEINIDSGYSYTVVVDFPNSDVNVGASKLEVLENGTPLFSAHSLHDGIRNKGLGRYSHWGRYLYFSSSDNSDPRINGYTYTIYNPEWMPHDFLVLFTLFLAIIFNISRIRIFFVEIQNVHPVWIMASLILVALCYRVFIASIMLDGTFHGIHIKGIPFSDAKGWFSFGVNYAFGNNVYDSVSYWDGRRQGYAWFLGAVFSIFGVSIAAVQGIQIALSIVSAGLIFDLLRRMMPIYFAIIASLSHVFLTYDAENVLTTMSEPLGYFCSNLGLWLLLVGCFQIKEEKVLNKGLILLFLSGVLFAYSNLVRPLNLMAMLPMALYLVWFIAKNQSKKYKWYLGLKASACFVLGVVLVISPWLLRQHATHGIWAITDNSVESLYAATTPKFGRWTPDVSIYTAKMIPSTKPNIAERYFFYKDEISKNLKKNFFWYIEHASSITKQHILTVSPEKWQFVLTIITSIIILGIRGKRSFNLKVFCVFFIFVGILFLPQQWYMGIVSIFWLCALFFALIRCHPMAFIGILLITTLVSLGMMAADAVDRFDYTLQWLASALSLWFLWLILSVASSGQKDDMIKISSVELKKDHTVSKYIKIISFSAIFLFIVGHSMVIYAHFHPKSNGLSVLNTEDLINSFLSKDSNMYYRPWKTHIAVHKASLSDDLKMEFTSNEDIGHWSPLFSPRAYSFVIQWFFLPIHQDVPAVMPAGKYLGKLEKDKDYYFLGIQRVQFQGVSFEILGIGSVNSKGEVDEWIVPEAKSEKAHREYISSWIE